MFRKYRRRPERSRVLLTLYRLSQHWKADHQTALWPPDVRSSQPTKKENPILAKERDGTYFCTSNTFIIRYTNIRIERSRFATHGDAVKSFGRNAGEVTVFRELSTASLLADCLYELRMFLRMINKELILETSKTRNIKLFSRQNLNLKRIGCTNNPNTSSV